MDQVNPFVFFHAIEHVKYAKPSCSAHGAPQSSQTAAEHMFRHALVCLLIPVEDRIDRDKLVTMALIHDITDFRLWDGVQQKKRLNMEYLACDLPVDSAKKLEDYWTEYWAGKTPEAQLAQELCAFEHMLALDEDGIASRDYTQSIMSSPQLQRWTTFLSSSKKEMIDFQNGACFGSLYWENPQENMRLLAKVISKDNLASSPLSFIRMARYMSTMKRKNWTKCGINSSDVESNASHSWGVALICLLLSPKDKAFNCAILGLIHDLGKIVIGNAITSDGIAKVDIRHHERFGQKFLAHVSQTITIEPYFTEFEIRESAAAQITHEANDLEFRIQAVLYILRYPQFDQLLEFLGSVPTAVYFQDLTNLLSKEESSLQEKQAQPTIIFVTGGPGVGKDTQCNKLAKELGFCHVPTGDLLRKEIHRAGSRYSKFIQQSIDIGFPVPAEIMISLLISAAKGLKWLVNGFPRSFNQLSAFEQQVSRKYSTLFLHCSDEVLMARLRHRAISSSRSDDQESVIVQRLQAYHNGNDLEIYLKERGPYEKVDSSGSEEEVYTLAKQGVERLLARLNDWNPKQ